MAYEEGGEIDDLDYNDILVGVPLPLASPVQQLNAIWGTGKGNIGYGQPNQFLSVTPGNVIKSSEWSELARYIRRMATWQNNNPVTNPSWPGTPLPSAPPTTPGSTISHANGAFTEMLANVHKYRMCNRLNGRSLTSRLTNMYTWSRSLTYTVRLQWASGDQARYFFNAGGQIAINFSYLTSSTRAVPQILKSFAQQMGTIYWTCNAGTQKSIINNVEFARLTRIGGSGNEPEPKEVDYYTPSLYDSTGVLLYKQLAKTDVPGYNAISASLYASTSGPKGLYEDNGSLVTLKLVIDIDPGILSGYVMPANSGEIVVTTLTSNLFNSDIGINGAALFQQSWYDPSTSISVLAI